MKHPWLLVVAMALAPQAASAACAVDQARVSAAVTAFRARSAQQPLVLDLDAARCFRRAFVRELQRAQGRVVGYKVGLYAAASRRTFGAAAPEIGVLLDGMLLDASGEISAALGFAPVAEADFVLVVADGGINRARTREEFYRHLRGYRPFVELPDNNYPPSTPVSAGQLVALNVNARAGVLGEERRLARTAAGLQQLADLSVETSVEGVERSMQLAGKARETLGDPVDIAMFARDALRREGGRLRAGDLISIGALVTPHAPRSGDRFRVRYRVGEEVSEISVRFGP